MELPTSWDTEEDKPQLIHFIQPSSRKPIHTDPNSSQPNMYWQELYIQKSKYTIICGIKVSIFCIRSYFVSLFYHKYRRYRHMVFSNHFDSKQSIMRILYHHNVSLNNITFTSHFTPQTQNTYEMHGAHYLANIRNREASIKNLHTCVEKISNRSNALYAHTMSSPLPCADSWHINSIHRLGFHTFHKKKFQAQASTSGMPFFLSFLLSFNIMIETHLNVFSMWVVGGSFKFQISRKYCYE